ncbi:hypothetical protein V6N13_109098 [Hibiscus sabdariffa]
MHCPQCILQQSLLLLAGWGEVCSSASAALEFDGRSSTRTQAAGVFLFRAWDDSGKLATDGWAAVGPPFFAAGFGVGERGTGVHQLFGLVGTGVLLHQGSTRGLLRGCLDLLVWRRYGHHDLYGDGICKIHLLHVLFTGSARLKLSLFVARAGWYCCTVAEDKDKAGEGKGRFVTAAGFRKLFGNNLTHIKPRTR